MEKIHFLVSSKITILVKYTHICMEILVQEPKNLFFQTFHLKLLLRQFQVNATWGARTVRNTALFCILPKARLAAKEKNLLYKIKQSAVQKFWKENSVLNNNNSIKVKL